MIPFILDQNGIAELHRIRDYGKTHPFLEDDLRNLIEKKEPSPCDDPKRTCILPLKYKITYSLEKQPFNWCHHVSITIINSERVPSIPMVEMVMEHLGFKGGINNQYEIWLDEINENYRAINVLGPAEMIPPIGYRYLQTGEIVEEGDLYWLNESQQWESATDIGTSITSSEIRVRKRNGNRYSSSCRTQEKW